MTLHLLDVASYQTGLRLEDVKAAGFRAVKFKLSHGVTLKAVMAGLPAWVDRARTLGLGVSTFHYLTDDASGSAQAAWAYRQLTQIGGPQHIAHEVDCEADATWQVLRDYVAAFQDMLGRRVAVYTGRWWWQPRGWNGANLTPYLSAAPNVGYLSGYPGDDSPHWTAGYGGWPRLSVLQYAVAPLPGGSVEVSKSAIRDLTVWAGLTGGDHMVAAPDPGNSPPEAWTKPMRPEDVAEVRRLLGVAELRDGIRARGMTPYAGPGDQSAGDDA